MSFQPDSIDAEITERDLLIAILIELKRLNVMVSEMTEQRVLDEDIE